MEFAHPHYLYLLTGIILLVIWYIFSYRHLQADLQISSASAIKPVSKTTRVKLRHLPFIFRMAAIAFIIIVLARPQSTDFHEKTTTEGIDIILAIDISGSMLARDFTPDRLEAAKDVAVEFISGRPNDRIGLVVFSAESFTQCPLTNDHATLINLFKDIKSGIIEDGTAIGLGLSNAVTRLKNSEAISKVVILLTDGMNNTGSIDPITAAEIAKTFGIRVYTIGVGMKGMAPYPFQDVFGRTVIQKVPVEIDEPVLQEIADMTSGNYFRATNNEKLRQIYAKIDQLEKSKIDVKEYSRKQEEYRLYAGIALLLLFIEMLLRYTVFRGIP
ncbi:MAG: VWA domain-containing protein [Bacteroidales bacterium]|nr:VWA domain-containing protein [Bacteroidales bacterium]MBN2764156.1 VWA domain-containing protein [Bacteroidales bacterium]